MILVSKATNKTTVDNDRSFKRYILLTESICCCVMDNWLHPDDPQFSVGAIIPPCPSPNDAIAKLTLKIGYGWVITPNGLMYIYIWWVGTEADIKSRDK